MQYGRKVIYCDEPEITSSNLIKVLQQAMIDFLPNAEDCTYLLNYEKGIQGDARKKLFRKEINNWYTDNLANEITQFKIDFNWQNITLIQRGEKDSGGKDEPDAIALLNECYDTEEIKKKFQQLARFVEPCGIGYTLVEINTEWEDGDSPFKINVLDPRCAFVVRSNYYTDHRIVLGVTFRRDSLGNTYFTCYTKHQRFEVLNTVKIMNGKTKRANKVDEWNELERSGEENPLHCIPIIEWIRDYDRMGCFERQLSAMDNVNQLISDYANDVQGQVECLWMYLDIDFPKDENGNEVSPKSGDAVRVFTSQDGKTPDIKPLTLNHDYNGMLNHITYRVNRIKEKCNIPLRSEANNSTGIAVSDSSGWTNAEIEANRQDQIKYGCKMEEVKVVLAAIRETAVAKVDDGLLKLRYKDIEPSIRRQKNYELSAKSATLKNLLSCGVNGLEAFKICGLFEDVNQAFCDSADLVRRYQDSLFNKQNTTTSDEKPLTTDGGYESQIQNSKRLDGMNKSEIINSEKEL
ncbi:MAG: phage portal protein [Lachnospiraceae bacterium]|nr:phage portal protein [Lachnospiraceae bacterium]